MEIAHQDLRVLFLPNPLKHPGEIARSRVATIAKRSGAVLHHRALVEVDPAARIQQYLLHVLPAEFSFDFRHVSVGISRKSPRGNADEAQAAKKQNP